MDEEIVQTSDQEEAELEFAENTLEYWKNTSSAVCASYASLHRQYQAVCERQELLQKQDDVTRANAQAARRPLEGSDVESSPMKRVKVRSAPLYDTVMR